MLTVYGIPNCESVKKTLTFLHNRALPTQFHNYKKDGINTTILQDWCKQVGWETLLNKKGTTWRNLDETAQGAVTNARTAASLMAKMPSLIKRPVITDAAGRVLIVGFNERELFQL